MAMTDRTLLITGGTGFIGHVLCTQLIERGYDVHVLSRRPSADVRARCGAVTPVSTIGDIAGGPGFGAVINLAGEGIAAKRWSARRKQQLRNSRIALTEDLIGALRTCARLPEVMVSGSAVGYYGAQGNTPVTEETHPAEEFTHRLCADWEQAAAPLADQGTRVAWSRTGLVVGADGGFLEQMVIPFKLGLGGRISSGQQYMPWVHRADVVNAILWMLEEGSARGPYNVVSPEPVTNAEFSRTLASVLGRPALFPVPAPALKLALGEMARLLLTGQKALPSRLQHEGFSFQYPTLTPALEDALGK